MHGERWAHGDSETKPIDMIEEVSSNVPNKILL